MDSKGLVESGRRDLQQHKKPYAHRHEPVADLLSAVKELKPDTLIGVSAKAGQFTRDIVSEMAARNERPIIFALSNPTANAECTAEQAYAWSAGKAIFASGSPFAPVRYNGKLYTPGQGNNAYIFPGVGLGIVASAARLVTNEMFLEAARALADCVEAKDLENGCLYPPLTRILDVSARIAAAAARVAFDRGLASAPRPKDILGHIRASQYQAEYR